jgi:hypothetical protein
VKQRQMWRFLSGSDPAGNGNTHQDGRSSH